MTVFFSIVCFILMDGKKKHEQRKQLSGVSIPVILNNTLKSLGK